MSRFSVPETVFFDITPHCNLRCRHCYSSDNPNYVQKSFSEICHILSQLSHAGVFKIDIVGREPLMRQDIERIIEYASLKKFIIKISTNGTLINDDIAKMLSNYAVKSVQISIDSVLQKKHNEFRRSWNAYERTIKGIKLLKRYDVKICIATTLTSFNWYELEDIIRLSYEMGAYHYRTRLLIGDQKTNHFQINKRQYKETVRLLNDLRNNYDDMTIEQLHHSFLFEKDKEYDINKSITVPCGAGIFRCSLTYDFRITPCIALAHLYSSSIKSSFVDEWRNNNVFDRWLGIFKAIKGKCRVCGYRYLCGGGCRANVYGVTYDIFSEDPWCWFNPEEEERC